MIDPQRIFVHVPYFFLANYRDIIRKAGLSVEVLVEAQNLEVATLESLASEVRALKEATGRVSIHAPYEGLDPGHPVEAEREETLRLLTLTCGLAQAAGATYVVAHTGYEKERVEGDSAGWVKRSLDTWRNLLTQPASIGVNLALEHTFEPNPAIVRSIVEPLPPQQVGVCLDTGHLNCFADSPPADWWVTLGNRIAVIHLHDNMGEEDEHLGIGQGTFDFDALFRWLGRTSLRPFLSIEGKDPMAVAESFAALGFPVDDAILGS